MLQVRYQACYCRQRDRFWTFSAHEFTPYSFICGGYFKADGGTERCVKHRFHLNMAVFKVEPGRICMALHLPTLLRLPALQSVTFMCYVRNFAAL